LGFEDCFRKLYPRSGAQLAHSRNDYLLEMIPNNQRLIDKYRPSSVEELVLPTAHSIAAALSFTRMPRPSGWLLHGKSGLGKSSLADIMAAAASDPFHTSRYLGPDVDIATVRQMDITCATRPMLGGFHTMIIDEADAIPPVAQVRLLGMLDRIGYGCVIFTSNDELDDFDARFLSRLQCQLFTSQGLLGPASIWLMEIARKEEIPLKISDAERLVRNEKNNLRGALQALDAIRDN
jgi:replication-associated recombination protein RarA